MKIVYINVRKRYSNTLVIVVFKDRVGTSSWKETESYISWQCFSVGLGMPAELEPGSLG